MAKVANGTGIMPFYFIDAKLIIEADYTNRLIGSLVGTGKNGTYPNLAARFEGNFKVEKQSLDNNP